MTTTSTAKPTTAAAPQINAEAERVAERLFAASMAPLRASVDSSGYARAAFTRAEEFLRARDQFRAGELAAKPQDAAPQLADCCCPNQPRNHPHNLVSSRYGDSKLRRRIYDWMRGHPLPTDPGPNNTALREYVETLNRQFNDLNWDWPTIKIASAIFPAYADVTADAAPLSAEETHDHQTRVRRTSAAVRASSELVGI